MISILPCNDKNEIEEIFKSHNINCDDNSGCVIARAGEEICGMCLYELYDRGITVCALQPQNDIFLADGILRSALHVAAERSAMDAHYAGDDMFEILSKLGFVKNKKERSIDIDRLFKGCKCEDKG